MGVAALLRETRIKQGRDIAVVATTLRIRQPYLQAIEEGRFQDLPGSTYAVGFVRGYAEYLGLDGPEIVRRFKQENSDLAGRAELVFPSATSGGGIPTGALLGFAVVGAVIAYGAWYFLQDRGEPVAEAVPPLPERLAALIHKPVEQDAPPAAQRPAASSESAAPAASEPQQVAALPEPAPAPAPEPQPQAAPQPEPAPGAPAATAPDSAPAKALKQVRAKAAPAASEPPKVETPAAPAGDNPAATASADGAAAPAADAPKPEKVVWKTSKRVRIKATADCWVKVRDADGKVVVSRLLHAGDTFAPPGNPGLTMTVGNAGALTVVLDGRELPPLGAEGVVKKVGLDPQKLGGSPDEPTETPSAPSQE